MNRSIRRLAIGAAGAILATTGATATTPAGSQDPLADEVIAWSHEPEAVGDEETDGDIWLMRGDGAGKGPLSSSADDEAWPRWSFDGGNLAWRGASTGAGSSGSDTEDQNDLWIGNPDGTGVTTAAQPGTMWIVPSPNGQRFANHQGGDIRVSSFESGSGTNITNSPTTDDGFASWSPDGSRVVYKSSPPTDTPGDTAPADLEIRNADGSGLVQLTDSEEFDDRFPQWSPVSDQIVFGRSPFVELNTDPTVDDIWIINADGSNATNLTDAETGERNGRPRWAPDGGLIAYNFSPSGASQEQLWVMNPDGTDKRRLDADGRVSSGGPFGFSWSPDSSKIVYKVDAEPGQLVVVDVASGDVVVSTAPGIGANRPDWSSNSDWIVYEAELEESASKEIFVIAAQSGAEPMRLTGTDLADDQPDAADDTKPRFAPRVTPEPPPTPPPSEEPPPGPSAGPSTDGPPARPVRAPQAAPATPVTAEPRFTG